MRQLWNRLFLLDDRPGRNPAMEGLRGYAVLLVFLVHFVGNYCRDFRGQSLENLGFADVATTTDRVLLCLFKGHYGVDIFFLLSGFLIARLLSRRAEDFSYPAYVAKRAVRIYPAFVLSLAGVVVVSKTWDRLDSNVLVQNLFFLNGIPNNPVFALNGVTWSLFYEFTFYLLAPVLFCRRGRGRGYALLLAGAVSFCLLPRWAMFLFGGFWGTRSDADLRRLAARVPGWAAVTACAAAVAWFVYYPYDYYRFVPLFGPACSLLFLKACYGRGVLNRLFASTALRWVGNISYSMYLLLNAVTALTISRLRPILPAQSPVLAFAILLIAALALCLFASGLQFLAAERWYFRERRWGASGPKARPLLRVGFGQSAFAEKVLGTA